MRLFDKNYNYKITNLGVCQVNNDIYLFLKSHGKCYCVDKDLKQIEYDEDNLPEILNESTAKFYIPINAELLLEKIEVYEDKTYDLCYNEMIIMPEFTLTGVYRNQGEILQSNAIFINSKNLNECGYIDFLSHLTKKEYNKDIINTFFQLNKSKITSLGLAEVRPLFEFADGTKMSIQASKYHYSSPQEDNATEYFNVECGFPSKAIPELLPYAENPHAPTETVYPYVPVDLINEIIIKKGINKGFQEKYLKNNNIER